MYRNGEPLILDSHERDGLQRILNESHSKNDLMESNVLARELVEVNVFEDLQTVDRLSNSGCNLSELNATKIGRLIKIFLYFC